MKMRPSDAQIVWLGCFGLFVAAVSLAAETPVYGKVGGEVVLRPPAGSMSDSIKQIWWKEGSNKAMEWDGGDNPVDAFRQFKERGHLNNLTGEMTIRGLVHSDSNFYTPEINRKEFPPVRLIVLSPVPKPTVNTSCDENTCKLTCEGATTGAEPVTYRWKLNNNSVNTSPGKQYTVHKENSSSSDEFICEMYNPVSLETSEPVPISFSAPPSEGGPNISAGVTVLIVLLTAVVLLVAFHKWKSGTWFFEKDSMPWEADFWRKSESHRREPPASNGSSAHQHNINAEEVEPMTKT